MILTVKYEDWIRYAYHGGSAVQTQDGQVQGVPGVDAVDTVGGHCAASLLSRFNEHVQLLEMDVPVSVCQRRGQGAHVKSRPLGAATRPTSAAEAGAMRTPIGSRAGGGAARSPPRTPKRLNA